MSAHPGREDYTYTMVAGGGNSIDPQAKKEAWLVLKELKPSGFGTAQNGQSKAWGAKALDHNLQQA